MQNGSYWVLARLHSSLEVLGEIGFLVFSSFYRLPTFIWLMASFPLQSQHRQIEPFSPFLTCHFSGSDTSEALFSPKGSLVITLALPGCSPYFKVSCLATLISLIALIPPCRVTWHIYRFQGLGLGYPGEGHYSAYHNLLIRLRDLGSVRLGKLSKAKTLVDERADILTLACYLAYLSWYHDLFHKFSLIWVSKSG